MKLILEEDDNFDHIYHEILDVIDNENFNPRGCKYSAFQTNSEGKYINNLNEIAVYGSCSFYINDWEKPWKSDIVLHYPTWLDLFILFCRAYQESNEGQYHRYCYFDGISDPKPHSRFKNIMEYRFDAGS